MHQSVLLNEAVEALDIHENDKIIDATFGRGGHSQAILEKLGVNGRLIVMDKDPEAIAHAEKIFIADPRVLIRAGSFSELENVVCAEGWQQQVNAVLLDLGVSSPQLDTPERGFSFRQDGPLDMRMDTSRGPSAEQWINTASMEDIARVLKEYGEERFAKRIARRIVEVRETTPITRTLQLADLVASCVKTREKNKHPATRSFQAIRIEVNRELEELTSVLEQGVNVLASGGVLAVITFHSLEDRIVKRFFRKHSQSTIPKNIPVRASELTTRLLVPSKAILPSDEEIARNPRARSAKLRKVTKR